MKTVLTYGTFDTLHYGHINLLRQARLLGDRLIVGLSTDAFNSEKNKRASHSWLERKQNLETLRCVDRVFEESCWEQKIPDIKFWDASVFAIGSDWSGRFDFLNSFCEVVYLSRTAGVSSTLIRDALGEIGTF